MNSNAITYASLNVNGLEIAYREAGTPGSPKLVLLHGFPSSSHQYRNLIRELAGTFHILAPDYQGFGNSERPDPATYAYTFDALSETVEAFLRLKGFDRYGLFMQDYGGPVGFRVLSRNPEALTFLVVQNSNAYEVGFTAAWDGFRNALWLSRTAETEAPLAAFLEHDLIRHIYLAGAGHPELVSPDNWEMDSFQMERPFAKKLNMDLFYDYRNNVPLYSAWQKLLRELRPKTILFWGQRDIFFSPEGGEAFLADLPDAEMHRLEAGHFAVEDHLEEIASKIISFHQRKIAA